MPSASVDAARVYVVSGGGSAAQQGGAVGGSSLPDLLRRHGSSNKRQKRKSAISRDEELARIQLIQDFEFPEASNVIRSTRDGQNIVATGMYKPQMRVWECEQLSLKFERHTDAENIDFIMLSDDWTKSLHLQTDRTVELHGQGGHHARLRIPKFGRTLGYHFPSATALVGARGREVYRFNLDQGRFLEPFTLGEGVESVGAGVTGCNAMDVNPAHGLISLGTEGAGTVELWDPRTRRRAGQLGVGVRSVLDASLQAARRKLPGITQDEEGELAGALEGLSVSALCSKEDGLNLAVGTSTGHVLLYDLRMTKPYAEKDQGFGLPIKTLAWPGDAPAGTNNGAARVGRTEAHDAVLSADAKVVKVWSREKPGENIVSITPSPGLGDLNHVHHIPGTGLVVAAVEGTQCGAWYVPALGPAPRWCSFLDSLTDELDGEQLGTSTTKGVYQDFKFIDKAELELLNMTHLVGTDLLRPYMHGFFVSLRLYEKARLLANPTAYADARARAIQARIDKAAESRIRATPKDRERIRQAEKALEGVRVNRDLAEKLRRDAEREQRKLEKRAERAAAKAAAGEDGEEAGEAEAEPRTEKEKKAAGTNLLADERFKALFTDEEFQVDETTREYAMLNPSSAVRGAAGTSAGGAAAALGKSSRRTAVEEEEDASDRESVDPDQESDADSGSSGDESDSSDEGDLGQYDARQMAPGTRRRELERKAGIENRHQTGRKDGGARLVDEEDEEQPQRRGAGGAKAKTFQQRLQRTSGDAAHDADADAVGGKEFSWTPSAGGKKGSRATEEAPARAPKKRRGDEEFGAGLSRGAGAEEGVGVEGLAEEARHGRQRRRDVGRSASKNVMRNR